MARGWESKAVADQIEEGNSARPGQSSVKSRSGAERDRLQRIQSLGLSRSRLLQQLELAKHPAHRKVLLSGLQAIESEIDGLSVALEDADRVNS